MCREIIIKQRSPSVELRRMRQLSFRMVFRKEDREYLFAMEKGYEGEVKFDEFYKNCPSNWLVMNDLWLKHEKTITQIDSLLITPRANYIFEIKNMEELYELINGKFFKNGQETRTNPLTQLERCDSTYRHLLRKQKFDITVVSNLMFINPAFTLYGVTKKDKIYLPTQIRGFFEDLKQKEAKYNSGGVEVLRPTAEQFQLVNEISSIMLPGSPYSSLPHYTLESLQKGILCSCCAAYLAAPVKGKKYLTCHQCGNSESVQSCILRSVEEFRLLFPEEKITTKRIMEWCKVIECKWKIIRVLNQNFIKIGTTCQAFYVEKGIL